MFVLDNDGSLLYLCGQNELVLSGSIYQENGLVWIVNLKGSHYEAK